MCVTSTSKDKHCSVYIYKKNELQYTYEGKGGSFPTVPIKYDTFTQPFYSTQL